MRRAILLLLLWLCACVVCAKHTHPSTGKAKHVVVLMLENRSFDHMLGHLKSRNPDINGLNGDEKNPYDPLRPAESLWATVSFDAPPKPSLNPDHQVNGTNIALWGSQTRIEPAAMSGFLAANGGNADVMKCHSFRTVPVLSTLAENFGLFDAFYASVPGPTSPNRLYIHSATSHGAAHNVDSKETEGYPQRTIYNDLDDSGLSWGVYYKDFPTVLQLDRVRLHPTRIHLMHKFYEALKEPEKLPAFSFLTPRWFDVMTLKADSEHPEHSVYYGELFLREVYEQLVASPAWNETVLIVCYDEHGGFYDHQQPPDFAPNPDGLNSTLRGSVFNFDRLGLRTPFVVVSPLVERAVHHEPPQSHYEHSSVIKTVRKWLNMTVQKPLTRREEWAASFEHVLSRTTPRTDYPKKLPMPPMKAEEAYEYWASEHMPWAKNNEELPASVLQRMSHLVELQKKKTMTDLQEEVVELAAQVVADQVAKGKQLLESELHLLKPDIQNMSAWEGALYVRRVMRVFQRE